eukprot:5939091-Amphidinium_carterae.1
MDEMVAPMVNDQLRAHHVGALANFRCVCVPRTKTTVLNAVCIRAPLVVESSSDGGVTCCQGSRSSRSGTRLESIARLRAASEREPSCGYSAHNSRWSPEVRIVKQH